MELLSREKIVTAACPNIVRYGETGIVSRLAVKEKYLSGYW